LNFCAAVIRCSIAHLHEERENETVNRHPDSDTLLAFREHRLSGSAVAAVALHVGGCARCAKVEPSAGRAALEALAVRGLDDHLSDEELDAMVDDHSSYSLISRHAAACAMCAAEVEDLCRFDAEGHQSPLPASSGERVRVRALLSPHRDEAAAGRGDLQKRWLIAAAVACAVLVLSAIALFLRRAAPDAAPVTASNPPAPVAPATVTAPPAPRVVASLADAGGRIELREDGTIAGVELLSPGDAEDARAALSGRSLAIPAFIAAMPGAVRGGDASTHPHPLRAIEPFRSAVREARPRFSWAPVNGARSYRVAVFDADYDEVARSEALNGTSWTPPTALPAGVDLSWHVVAETDAGEISSAGPDRAEAVFRVLTPKEAAEVGAGEDHYRGAHLLRGLLYSRHGLLHDARREFRALAEQNPDSPVARALISTVSR
jgi:hypothetical protein